MSEQSADRSLPWYRQFWVWFVIAIPASSVLLGITLVTIATMHRAELVNDDWSKDGLAINKRFDRQHKAQEMGLNAHLTLDYALNRIQLDLQHAESSPTLRLELLHPTRANLDRSLEMIRTPAGTYIATLATLPQGRYYLRLTDQERQWQLDTTATLTTDAPTIHFTP
jgi:hypothetical protein